MKENTLSRPLPVTAWLHKSLEPLLGKLVFFKLLMRTKAPCTLQIFNAQFRFDDNLIGIREPRCLR